MAHGAKETEGTTNGLPPGLSPALYAEAYRAVANWEDQGDDPAELVIELFHVFGRFKAEPAAGDL